MKFFSIYHKYKLVLKPERTLTDTFGNTIVRDGITCSFTDGQYETEDPEIISALLAHVEHGRDFRSQVNDKVSEAGVALAKKEEEASENLLNSCPKCATKCKSAAELRKHISKYHERDGSVEVEVATSKPEEDLSSEE